MVAVVEVLSGVSDGVVGVFDNIGLGVGELTSTVVETGTTQARADNSKTSVVIRIFRLLSSVVVFIVGLGPLSTKTDQTQSLSSELLSSRRTTP